MTIYRALRTLETGKRRIEQGAVFPDNWLKPTTITILEEQGKIAPALLPPIFAMPPPYKGYNNKLSKAGIANAADWMEADDSVVAKAIGVSAAKAADLKAQLFTMFSDPRRKG